MRNDLILLWDQTMIGSYQRLSLSVNAVKRLKTYLLFVGSQIAVHFLRLEEGEANLHGKANIQHSLLHVH